MTAETKHQPISDSPRPEPTPPLGSWPRLYLAVLAHLAFWIAALLVFTSRFGP